MIDIKEAVGIGTKFLVDMFPDAQGVRLEEVDLTGQYWHVVLSFDGPEPSALALMKGQTGRIFKDIKIDLDSGEALGMKVWQM